MNINDRMLALTLTMILYHQGKQSHANLCNLEYLSSV